MRKYLTILSVCILILPIINVIPSKSIVKNDSVTTSNDIINESIINQIEKQHILQNLNNLDGFFTENRGQVSNDLVRYYIQGKGVWFLDDGVMFEIREEISIDSRESKFPFDPPARLEPPEPPKYRSVVLKLNFEGANRIIPEGCGLLTHRSNFFYGNVSSKWCADVPNFQEIIYENLYDNIDLRYYTTTRGLKYDFIVHPGGEPDDIKLEYEGAQGLYIDTSGNLRIQTQLKEIVDSKVFIYQEADNKKIKIEGEFKILFPMTYGFELIGGYDRNRCLIIDPLLYSTFIGGNNDDLGYNIELDVKGHTYIAGWTESDDFPNTTGIFDTGFNGNRDVFVLKLNPTGSALVYSTYIGGSNNDNGRDIEIDNNGNTYITGYTDSSNFPITSNTYDTILNGDYDCFVIKLNSTGTSLIYSTFIGGINDDSGMGIAIDNNKNTYITGSTWSNNFPNTTNAYDKIFNGGEDVFVFKLNSTGSSLIYSSFIGGIDQERSFHIVIDSSNNAYVVGETHSYNFPNTTGAFDTIYNGGLGDVFVFKLNSVGSSLSYSTFIGGSDYEFGLDIAIDPICNIYITGVTKSPDFPNTTGAFDTVFNGSCDGFVLKLNPTGSALLFSTFIGGSDWDGTAGIEIDSSNNVYVTSGTNSPDFPNTTNAYDNIYNGNRDVFVLKLNSTGSSLLYSSFIGGTGNDQGVGIEIDSGDNIYVTGVTSSSDFPITPEAFDTSYNGGGSWWGDTFVFKLNPKLNISIPAVLDLKISKATVFRNNTIHLYSNATDTDDLEKNLTPYFEYRDPNKHVWNSTCFSNTQYNNARWEVSFILAKNTVLGLYDFRVMFNDTEMLFTSWFYLNDSFTVLNNIPKVENLYLSNDKTILGDKISIWINGTDVEESEENLTIELEYRDLSEQLWNTTYLNIPKFINNRWKNNFTILFNASFGYYDFRVRFNDSDGDYSQWFYSNDSLLIYNIRPKVIDIELSKYLIYRTNSVFLSINGTDHETEEPMLTFYAQYRPDGRTEWTDLTGEYDNLNDRWETEFNTNKESILGVYDFRIKFMDNESASSGWQYLNDSLKVLNNRPVISGDLDNIKVNITPILINLSQYESDIEDTNVDLIWNVNKTKKYDYIEYVAIIDSISDSLEIVPIVNVTGEVDIELTLTDKDGGTATKSDITVHVDSRITELIPKVILLSPVNGTIVNTLTPKLEWRLDYYGDEIITYSVYLDENPDPGTIIKSGISITSYILEDELEAGKTYYWKVIPGGGICLSEPFSFTIDLDFKPIYNVNLTTEKAYIIINQGASIEVNLTVKNEGNGQDNFKIEYNSSKLQSLINIDKSNIQLAPGIKSTLKLNISIPDNFELGEYSILVTGTSLSDETVSDKVTIIIKVVSKDFIPIYGVAISVLPESIEIVQGKSENVTLIITNVGNIIDDYNITFESDDFTIANINLSDTFLSLREGVKAQITVMITVPEDMKRGEYKLEFIAKSDMASNNTSLAINIKEVDGEIKPDNEKSKENNTMFYIGIIIIIIIIILIFILLIKRKKRQKQESELSTPENVIPKTTLPKQVTILEKGSPVSPTQWAPSTTVNPTPVNCVPKQQQMSAQVPMETGNTQTQEQDTEVTEHQNKNPEPQ